MAKEKPKEKPREIRTEVFVPYEVAVGPTWSTFFDYLKEERIMGTRCSKCKRIFVPPRTFCPRCFEEMEEWVQVADEGTIETWSYATLKFYAQIPEPPFITVQVRLDGCDTGFLHRIAGFDLKDFEKVNRRVKLGGRVKAVWRKKKEGNINDIDYFKPIK
ncbi:MAG: Zn-ribbon domain-containing OB-fold protein [Deltaproteobacteria bacterium]|nr:Zn-ribbon domain-containing OB-fold protein [Deltaproteobacteria bacterium]